MATFYKEDSLDRVSRRELRAIYRHYVHLRKEHGPKITYKEAMEDWFEHCAVKWRKADHLNAMAIQRRKMKEHKWLRSEEVGYDVGQMAYFEWIHLHGPAWRYHYEKHDPLLPYP
ncbi:MAG: hypothetical protein GX130_02835 [Candidatus Hydrogenedens sp.]|jgi:hypothetical protein|nr:hypothetical protein [Candidatus Hydrogenedens sp.]